MVRAKRIFCVIAYDISDNRQRNRVVKMLQKYGVRVNLSVFECIFTESQFEKVKKAIETKISRDDSIVYYTICVNCYTKIVYQPKRMRSIRTIEIC